MVKWIIIGIVVVLIIAIIGWFIGCYNKLVKSRNKVRNSWSQIDVQLKRRFDLIPNLVSTVKGYAAHENSILEEFAKARNVYSQASSSGDVAEMSKANNMLSSTLSRLIAVSEAYPELKADKHFTELMGELSKTEDKIAYTRQFYNDVVMTHNNLIEVFPGSIVASMFGFKQENFFEADDASRENVKVQF